MKVFSGCSAVAALVCGALAHFFWTVGSAAHWTSDGPGILFIMILFGVFALGTVLFGLSAILPASWIAFFDDL
ncbi:hypothetical protein L6R52_04415 [Myxococcota bacterium]|nr:hypothetical protein [Myxococcota bacterium]